MTIYHSIPKEVMMDDRYLALLNQFGPNVKHILDCPESNIPVLSKSKANFFTDRIKMVCPLLFPTASVNIQEEMKELETNA